MTATLPAAFADRLTRILPADRLDGVLASFAAVKDVAFRINTLKAQPDAVLAGLRAAGLNPRPVAWSPLAWVVDAAAKRALRDKLYNERYEAKSKSYLAELRKGAMIEMRGR